MPRFRVVFVIGVSNSCQSIGRASGVVKAGSDLSDKDSSSASASISS